MRDICEVINSLLKVVPEEQTEFRSELSELLVNINERIPRAAPEMFGEWWRQANVIINMNLPQQGKFLDWQKKVVSIWTKKA